MQSILLIVHIVMALALIGLILIQHGKGADAGAAFGSGASSTFFGSSGSTSFLTRATGILAFVFFANSFFLSYLSTTGVERESLMKKVQVTDGIDTAPVSLLKGKSEEAPVSSGSEPATPPPSDLPSVVEKQPAARTDLPEVPEKE